MATKSEITKILILHESRDEAEHLLNLLRNSGRAARGQLVDNEETLAAALNTSPWDLMLLRPGHEKLSASDCLLNAARISKDIPAILLIDDNDSHQITEGLKEGFQDVVPVAERQRLMLVINRELKNLKERRSRRQAELNLKEAEKRCSALLATSRDAITYVTDGMHTYGNQAYLDLFGYETPEELEGMPIMDMVAPEDHDAFKQFLRAYGSGEHKTNEFNCKGLTTDGRLIVCSMVFSSATFDGEPCTQIVIRANQTDAQLQAKINEISSLDTITGLYNRRHVLHALEETLEWTLSHNKIAALLYVQIDNFSALISNPAIGIGGGDIVLANMAAFLRELLPHALLARFSDDVFIAILRDVHREDTQRLAETIRARIEEHLIDVHDRTAQVTASIGVTMIAEDVSKADDVLNRAVNAIDRVRERSPQGNGVAMFDPAQKGEAGDASITRRVQEAIDRGLFKILFQPIIDLRGGGGELYEVFVRMLDESGKLITPDQFMGVAQANKVCEKIDRWVILHSVKMLAEHRARGHDTHIVINITDDSMRDPTLRQWLEMILGNAQLTGNALIFQINENDATTYIKQARDFAASLRDLQCQVSISRFGCIANPFNTLKHIPVDYVKLDARFTRDLSTPENREMLKELVTQAHAQGKLTIASFVESASVLSSLWQIGVNYIQGYYLQVPSEQMNYDFTSE